jgi:hypothetical protein
MKYWVMALATFWLAFAGWTFGAEKPTTANEAAGAIQTLSERLDAVETQVGTVESILRDGWMKMALGGALGVLATLVFFSLLALFIRKLRASEFLRCFELGMLIAVFLLILLGAYRLTSKIVDTGGLSHASVIADVPGESDAVLRAYDQLSGEMERWFALFGVLGTFFGLILPVGAYFLQIRSIRGQEEKTEKTIHDKIEGFEKRTRKFDGQLSGFLECLNKLGEDCKSMQEQQEHMQGKLERLDKDSARLLEDWDDAKSVFRCVATSMPEMQETIENMKRNAKDVYKMIADSIFCNIVEYGGRELATATFAGRQGGAGLTDPEKNLWQMYLVWSLYLLEVLGNLDDPGFVHQRLKFVVEQLRDIKNRLSQIGAFPCLQEFLKQTFHEVNMETQLSGALKQLKSCSKVDTTELKSLLREYGLEIM